MVIWKAFSLSLFMLCAKTLIVRILSCATHSVTASSLPSSPVQRRRCWVTMAACTWRSSCRSPCTRRPRTCRCASCPSGPTACSWPPPPRSQRTRCDWSWTEAASSSPWTWVSHWHPSWLSLLTFILMSPVSSSSPCLLVLCNAELRGMVWHFWGKKKCFWISTS